MSLDLRAQVVVLPEDDGPLRLDEVLLPEPGPHQVILRQFASGICHSQLHQMHSPRTGPVLLGHESTGVVLAAGPSVTEVQEGERVMVTWVPRRPMHDRVPEIPELKLADGSHASCQNVFTWADHAIVDEAFVVPLPDHAPTDVTAIIGCAVMTGAGAVVRTADVRPGQSVAVFGVGGVGLSAVAAAAAVGADPVIAVDLDPAKLDVAKRFGATHLVNGSTTDAVEAIRELTRTPGQESAPNRPAGGVDFAFDCIGVKQTMEQIHQATRWGVIGASRGGVAVLVGIPQTNIELDTYSMIAGEKHYRGSVGGSCVPERDFPLFLHWHEQKKLDLGVLVTRRYSLSQINEATSALASGEILGRAILEFEP